MSRAAARWLGAAAILLGGTLLGFTGCGSVTAKKSDGGGTGGSQADSSTKVDVAADRTAEDARHDAPENHDASSLKDMRMADARTSDASSHGGSGGGGTGGGGGGAGGGSGGAGGAGECKSNGDCMLYTGLGSGCCGVCQPKSDPTPAPIQCLIACLDPLVTCGCVSQKCVGSAKQL